MWRKTIAPFTVAVAAAAVLVAAQPASSSTTLQAAAPLSDYNGDGHADIAIGEPEREINGVYAAGAVHVVYGTPSGLAKTDSAIFAQGQDGIPGAPSDRAEFGNSIASGDFDGNGYADIAVTAPHNPANLLTVLYGSEEGIQTADVAAFSYAQVAPISCCDPYAKVAAGDFDNDGNDDVAIGFERANIGATDDGAVSVLYGSSTGLDTARLRLFSQNTSGVSGTGENSDHFGGALAAGDFNGDSRSDLAIGTPGENVNDLVNAGSITVLLGSATGLTATGSAVFTQGSTNVAGVNESGDEFGGTLAAGDITGDGRDELVIGALLEDVGSVESGGSITVLRGSASGLTGTGSQAFTQNTSGVPDSAESSDWFGSSLTLGDFDADGRADLAVGTPYESLSAGFTIGTVTVIRGGASGLTTTGAKLWSQSTSGVQNTGEEGDLCGWSVRAAYIRGATQADLVFGCVYEGSSGLLQNGAIMLLPGSASGLTAEGDQFFSGAGLNGGAQSFGFLSYSLG